MASRHTKKVNEVLVEYGERGYLLWQNKTGLAWQRRGGRFVPVEFGMAGSPDIIGLKSRVIVEADVGETIAQFVGIEVKTGKQGLSEAQKRFFEKVGGMGALLKVEQG